MRKISKKTKVLALILVAFFSVSILGHLALAEAPDEKEVITVVGSYTVDGTTIYFVSHLTGVVKWIVEPTSYVPWEGGMIPVDGKFWVTQANLQHDKAFYDNTHITIISGSNSYTGTFEVVAVPPPPPGSPWSWPPYMPMLKDGIMNSHSLVKTYGEIGTSKFHTVTQFVDGVPRTLLDKALSQPNPPGLVSTLTGTIRDWGLDEDGNSLYDYLVVSVEARIRTSGFFYLGIIGLEDSNGGLIDVNKITYQYLDAGTQFIDIMLEGPIIHDSGLNPSKVYFIIFDDESGSNPSELHDVMLSREYSFEEFEGWPASLTGVISDEGVNTDANPFYDYLRIGVEVEVTEEGDYFVSAFGLRDDAYNLNSYVANGQFAHLVVGKQMVYLSFNGPTIWAGKVSPSFVESINLMDENSFTIDSLFSVPLPTKYTYLQFDVPGAGITIYPLTDKGLDPDSDLKYEYLEVGVRLGVGESGTYTLQAALGDSNGNFIAFVSTTTYLVKPPTPPPTVNVNLQFDGAIIYSSSLNPSKVLMMELYDENNNFIGKSIDRVLTRAYSYTEFDSGI